MKRLISIILLALVPVIGYSQVIDSTVVEAEKILLHATETVAVAATKAAAKAVVFVDSEVKQFKKETAENTPIEVKQAIKEAKTRLKYEMKYTLDAIHAGYSSGLRGEEYKAPYKHKYNNK